MNTDAAKLFTRVVLSDTTVQIKLIGDSITHGVGGTGFEQNGGRITDGFARNPNGYCWAKLFKEYVESQYDCRVINNGCTGTEIEYVIAHFHELVDVQDDLIICTIGTNNRHQFFEQGPKRTKREQMERFYGNLVTLQQMFKDAKKDVIFVANIPASAENEKDGENYWRLFHMNDLQDMYTKASLEYGFPLIRLYSLFLDYCEKKEVTIDSLLADGLHPNDAGYDVMFALITEELGIARKESTR